jgi:type I restriction enzyme S subunit
MAGEWKRVPVGEVCELIVDCVNKTAPVVDEPTPYKMLRTTNIKGGRINKEDCRRVSKETFEKWTRRADVRFGDVILTREAPLGEVGYVDFTDTVFLGQRLMQYRAIRAVLEPRFLLYSFLSKDLQNQFGAHEGSGSTVSHIRVGDCSKFEIPLPPLAEQKRIAEVLGALDDKIELNNRMNATLEATARALFQSWFVDFDPVRAKLDGRTPSGMDAATAALFPDSFEESEAGHIPRGWTAKQLPEAVEVNPRRILKAGTVAPYLDMKNLPTQGHSAEEVVEREFSSGTKFQKGDTLLARITPCLENGKTGYVDFLQDGQIGWGSTEYIVFSPKPPLPPQFGYLLARSDALRSHAIQNMTGTSGRQRVPSECFNTFWLAVPPPAIAECFDEMTAPMMAKIKSNSTESRTLAALRDTLLPKLLSGGLSGALALS